MMKVLDYLTRKISFAEPVQCYSLWSWAPPMYIKEFIGDINFRYTDIIH